MFFWALLSLMFAISFTLILASSPLTLGLWILFFALVISFNIGFMMSSWFAFIIFLIYVGGMLVMFAYFSALSPNQPLHMLKMLFMLLTTIGLIMFMSLPFNSLSFSFSNPTVSLSIMSLYITSNIPILLFMALVLFFILVAVVKIASINSGALRHFSFS
uniref:NADH dehydrogenase subunit 6 n=1 Tax=Pisione sp. YZ-2018 TaxID=2153337 RepID=A0A343W6I5_9ANNE|nr:NADH dehydrogenase subunit 6 [Pisione sp. YZ-2018]